MNNGQKYNQSQQRSSLERNTMMTDYLSSQADMSTQLESIFQQLSCVGQGKSQYDTNSQANYGMHSSLILNDQNYYTTTSTTTNIQKDKMAKQTKLRQNENSNPKHASNSQKRKADKIEHNTNHSQQHNLKNSQINILKGMDKITKQDKENRNNYCNKNVITKTNSQSNLNSNKQAVRKQQSKNHRTQSTNYVDSINMPLSIDSMNVLYPMTLNGRHNMTTMNRNNSNNGLINQKTLNLIQSRPLSPLSNGQSDNRGLYLNVNEQSYITQDPKQYQCLSPSTQSQSIQLRINDHQRLPPSQQNVLQSTIISNNHQSGEFKLGKSSSKTNLQKSQSRQQQQTIPNSYMTTLNHENHNPQNMSNYPSNQLTCSNCKKLENKLLRVNLQFESFFNTVHNANIANNRPQSPSHLNQNTTKLDAFDLLEQISNHLIEFKLQKSQYDQDKLKLQSDVEKLIKNQESFELKVKEMDDVYSMLIKEKQKLQEQKSKMDLIINNQKINLDAYRDELKSIKEQASEFKVQIRRAVEKEVKDTIYRKNRDKDYVYDYPMQIIEGKDSKTSNNGLGQTRQRDRSKNHNSTETHLTIGQIKEREQELDKKESKLYEWEAQLFEKKMKIDNLDEQLKGKVEKLNLQKSEIQQNLKKLQILTKNYETILQKEYEMTKMAEEIRTSKQQIEAQKIELDQTQKKIVSQREHLQKEQLDANKVDRFIARLKDQTQMIIEDNMSYLLREREKCLTRMREAEELKLMLQTEKQRWVQGVNDQQKKLQHLVDEKREQVLVMEVSMRQQIKEIRERQEQLEKCEKEFEEVMKLRKDEIENERKLIDKDREDVKCLMLEFEDKQGSRGSASKNKKKYKKTNMPRQMPNNNHEQSHQVKEQKNTFEYMLNSNTNNQGLPSQITNQDPPLQQKLLKHTKSLSQSHDFCLNSSQTSKHQQFTQPPFSTLKDNNLLKETQESLKFDNDSKDLLKNTFNIDNLLCDGDELLLLDDLPQYAQTSSQSKTPQINRKNSNSNIGMPPKPPSSILSQSTQKLFKKDSSSRNLSLRNSQNNINVNTNQQPLQLSQNQQYQNNNIGNNNQQSQGIMNDLSIDQDQQLEQLLMMSSQNSDHRIKNCTNKKLSKSNKKTANGKENENINILLITDEDQQDQKDDLYDEERNGLFNKNGQFQFDQYLASSQNDISLLNDDDEINFD